MKSQKKAFTLIELLVVVAIIAVLISMLLPALGEARKTARNVICQANLKQWGTGFQSYFQDYHDAFPYSYKSRVKLPDGSSLNPANFVWDFTIPPYLGQRTTDYATVDQLGCPELAPSRNKDSWFQQLGYSMNDDLCTVVKSLSKLDQPSTNVMLMEFVGVQAFGWEDFYYAQQLGGDIITYVPKFPLDKKYFLFLHGSASQGKGSQNVLFCDGRVASVTQTKLRTLKLLGDDAFWAGSASTYNGSTGINGY